MTEMEYYSVENVKHCTKKNPVLIWSIEMHFNLQIIYVNRLNFTLFFLFARNVCSNF